MIKLLVVTTLYPNSVQTRHGVFVETRLKKLLDTDEVTAEVIAPVPWFPLSGERFGQYGQYAQVPNVEKRDGIVVHHPRYLVIPKIGMLITPFTLAWAIKRQVKTLSKQGHTFDIVDGHYYYPDGVALASLKRFFNCPVIVTARGTDINLIPESTTARKLILWAAHKIDASVTVSQALKQRMLELGADAKSIFVFRNGVDLDFFKPDNELTFAHSEVEQKSKTLISVGNLIEAKGHHLVIEALAQLEKVNLLVVGAGSEKKNLQNLVQQLELTKRVQFLGNVTQTELVKIYNRCDALVLASAREGMPNVVLEAIACGLPVVATDVGGVREILGESRCAYIVERRDSRSISQAVKGLLNRELSRTEVRELATQFSWTHTVKGLIELFKTLLNPSR